MLAGLALTASSAQAATRSVVVRDLEFKTAVVRIDRGDSVRWLFRDGPSPHNVTSEGTPRFRASPSKQSGSYTFRFTRSGTYRYYCTIHPFMTGRVVVR